MPREGSRRRVTMVVFEDAQVLDITGPMEVFASANRCLEQSGRRPAYACEIVAPHAGPVRTSGGIALVADRSLARVRGPIDTLLVAGGVGVYRATAGGPIVEFLRRRAPDTRRVASVCSGTFALAAAGLLDGRRAATHWGVAEQLAAAYPAVRVERDPIFVRDGRFWTSAGVTAGMDLALAMLEEDLGRDLALEVARLLVLFLRRPGGQSQFSAQLASQVAEREPLREIQAYIVDHPGAALGVEKLAGRAGMSPRHFARVFAREVGMTPARFVKRARVGAARRALESSGHGIDEIAAACGFGSTETLRRSFFRTVRVNPSEYRARFRPDLPSPEKRTLP